MIDNKIFVLKQPHKLMDGVEFKGGEEFHIVTDVVYMNGAMLPPDLQPVFYDWITKNKHMFFDDTRKF